MGGPASQQLGSEKDEDKRGVGRLVRGRGLGKKRGLCQGSGPASHIGGNESTSEEKQRGGGGERSTHQPMREGRFQGLPKVGAREGE